MKKAASLIMTLVLCASMAIGVSAAGDSTTLSFTYVNDPSYTVTIPSAIDLDREGTAVEIEASDVQYLNDQVISVTFEGTQAFRHQFLLKLVSGAGADILYGITTADGIYMTTTGDGRGYVGTELVSFSDNGTDSFTITPITEIYDVRHGNEYTGTITYGIQLRDA